MSSEVYTPHHNPTGYWQARGPSGDHGCYTRSEAIRACKDLGVAYTAGLAKLREELDQVKHHRDGLLDLNRHDYAKLVNWVRDPNRSHPADAFTQGWARDAATAFVESGANANPLPSEKDKT